MKSINIGKRSIIGVFILLLGVVFFLDTLDILPISGYNLFHSYWPLLLIMIGVLTLFDKTSNNGFSIILIIVGMFYQLKKLGYIFHNVSLWSLIWPTVLIIVGIWFIFPKKKHEVSSDTLNNTVLFSGGDIYSKSNNFKGGELTALFGGLDVDLRDAVIQGSEPVEIDIFTAFGGIDMKVPDDWTVEVKCIPLFGGWDNKHRRRSGENIYGPVLVVKGIILFGGLDIN